MQTEPTDNGTPHSLWMRLLYIILFAVIFNIVELVITVVVVVQFLLQLLTGRVNQQLRSLGQSLGAYVYEIIVFLTYHADTMPYPFGPWPHWLPGETLEDTNRT
jgi:hypothetical protein